MGVWPIRRAAAHLGAGCEESLSVMNYALLSEAITDQQSAAGQCRGARGMDVKIAQ